MNKVVLGKMTFHAYHGVFEEENRIGGKFEVELEIETDFSVGMERDDLSGTLDYTRAYELVEAEMMTPSKLIEHLGGRIIKSLKVNLPDVQKVKLKLSKLNPPIKGEVESVSIIIEE
jgi:dihydroneopterin aldolase